MLETACLRVAIDDTPTARYGPCVEGAGIHHNPSPGPAGAKHVYGHVWVTLAALAVHPDWDTIALPLLGSLYIRQVDIDKLPEERSRPFRTKLEMAVEQLAWLQSWIGHRYPKRRVVTDGGYAKRPFLQGAKEHGFTVISRLRKDAALWSLPLPKPSSQPGVQATYGKERISLAKRAAAAGGWQQVECDQYGEKVTKTIKTFLATWKPAGGVIRVVLVKEEDDWLPYFAVGTEVTAVEILEAMADRGALEQTNKDVKEVWGAGEQQVRNLFCNEGCFNLNLWMYSLVEAWAWDKQEEELVDRSASPWDSEPRRPSAADKRKALQVYGGARAAGGFPRVTSASTSPPPPADATTAPRHASPPSSVASVATRPHCQSSPLIRYRSAASAWLCSSTGSSPVRRPRRSGTARASASRFGHAPAPPSTLPSSSRALTAAIPGRRALFPARTLNPAHAQLARSLAPDGSAYHITSRGSSSAWWLSGLPRQ